MINNLSLLAEAPPAPTLTPPTLSVTEGQSVSLQCSAPVPCPSVPPALTWSSVPGPIEETLQQQQDGTFVKVSTLTFTAAPSHHDRDISCSAAYNRGSDSVPQVSAPLRPSVTYQPRNTAVSLRCSSDANPAAEQYRWYKADGGAQTLIGNSSVIDIKVSENVSHIFCEAQNELGIGRSVVTQLNEHSSARILPSSSCTGDSSQMSCVCEAEGNPSPQMHWRFSGISTNISITNEALNDMSVRSVITVKEPQWRDPVSLVCHSSNTRGSDTQTFTVPAFQRRGPPTNTRVTVSPSGPVAEHTDVTLTCSSEANPAVELYSWYKDDGGAHALIVNSSFAVLNIKASKDTTAFFCQSQNDLGTDVSAVTRLNVQYQPQSTTVSVTPRGPVDEHSNVTVTCSSEANPAVQHYRWYKADGGALSLIGNSAVLNFRASKDSSQIFCEALNDVGTDRSTVTQLLINYRPRNTRVTVRPQTSVREHSHVSLTCSSDASPAVQHYRWYKDDGGALTVIGNSAVLTMNASKDTTAVFCEAQNDLGTDNSTVTRLDVQYQPQSTTVSVTPRGPVDEHSNVTVTCSSEANPAVQHYRWYKADGGALSLIGNSAVLNFRASKDSSQIFCEALNDVGTDRSAVTQLLINYRPRNTRVTVQPQTSVREHSHVSLTCSSDASPAVQHYRWYKDDGGALTVIGNSAVLTMNASKDTTAVFCEAQNDLGTDNSTVTRLDVQYSPRNTTISRLSFGPVVENDDVTLTCSSDASPAARLYRWYKADAETDTHIRDSAVLTMKASKDTTQIFCEALNDLGTDRSAVTHLDVRYHPRNTRVTVSPSGPVLEHHIVTLECSSDANPVVQRYSWHHADGGTLIGNSALLKMNASKNIADIFCRAQNDLGTDDSSNIPLDVQCTYSFSV
uniref:Ig-like domain-containing protein n=1 Tax=Neogobius melanostomus TaxID=47308 RepID=A0A8C6SNM6_9GOBI